MTSNRHYLGGGNAANQLERPNALAFDNDGNLYVCDCWNNRIQMFKIIDNDPCSATSTGSPCFFLWRFNSCSSAFFFVSQHRNNDDNNNNSDNNHGEESRSPITPRSILLGDFEHVHDSFFCSMHHHDVALITSISSVYYASLCFRLQ
jgi:hypothetical protein